MDGLMMDEQLLLTSLLWRTERLFPDKKIITRLETGTYHQYTYGDFAKRVRRLASALTKLGVAPGERVGTLAWNHYRHFELYYAIPGVQAVCHTINLRLFADQQRYIVNHAEDSILFLDVDQIPMVEALVADGIPTVKQFVIMCDGELPPTSLSPVLSYEELLATGDEGFEFPDFSERAAAAMCYTSATTGLPKGVVFSHRGIVLQTMLMATHDKIGLSENQVWMEVAPMFHCNGWNLPHACLMQGANIVFLGIHPTSIDHVQTIRDLKVTGINAAVTVGSMIRDFVTASDAEWDLSSLETLWLGGSAPSRAVMEWFQTTYGTFVLQGYGHTESSPQVCFNYIKTTLADEPEEDRWARRQTGGIPFPLMKVRIVDDFGEELPWDGTSMGHIHVRSPYTASAYYRDERTKDAIVDGWLNTGDIGCIDPQGFIILKDRQKDLIKSGGEWISSIDLENALMSHPKVREASVFAVPNEKWNERPVACVVPKSGDDLPTVDELAAFLGQSFAKWWLPDEYIYITEVPKTSVGKYDKKRLRSMVAEGGLSQVEATIGLAARE
ncbi:MAG: long-chain-fatty-acid--CoA ligase [Humibacillus sp.]|nr:long-chain-fatty-acid--CoA ligase [Humibacillus sp.]MDN5778565.1 long-chain-fatty-acid--CoA ligase [Humibacillus sp.]